MCVNVTAAHMVRRVLNILFRFGTVAAEPVKMAVLVTTCSRLSSDLLLSICISHAHRIGLLKKLHGGLEHIRSDVCL